MSCLTKSGVLSGRGAEGGRTWSVETILLRGTRLSARRCTRVIVDTTLHYATIYYTSSRDFPWTLHLPIAKQMLCNFSGTMVPR